MVSQLCDIRTGVLRGHIQSADSTVCLSIPNTGASRMNRCSKSPGGAWYGWFLWVASVARGANGFRMRSRGCLLLAHMKVFFRGAGSRNEEQLTDRGSVRVFPLLPISVGAGRWGFLRLSSYPLVPFSVMLQLLLMLQRVILLTQPT